MSPPTATQDAPAGHARSSHGTSRQGAQTASPVAGSTHTWRASAHTAAAGQPPSHGSGWHSGSVVVLDDVPVFDDVPVLVVVGQNGLPSASTNSHVVLPLVGAPVDDAPSVLEVLAVPVVVEVEPAVSVSLTTGPQAKRPRARRRRRKVRRTPGG